MHGDAGRMLRQGFLMLMRELGGPVLIHKSGQQTREVMGLKNHEKHNRSAVMFQFADPVDIDVGDVLQVKNSRDTWRVTEIEDHTVAGSLINVEARVERVGHENRRSTNLPLRNQIVINAPVHRLQVDSWRSSQTVITSTSPVVEAVRELKNIIDRSTIPELDREEITLALDRLGELSKRQKTADVIKRANEKLELVKNTLAVSKDLALLAAPYLPVLYRAFTT